ncbi:MAG: UDP-N-acetylmuramoyl-L-alanine--D-glutamate ligase [Candidatus Sericytochromatia bacterium]|nr:UDP-N-acetylmuramoyl-L-alanine--D-glutamate ligase [Candidatus Sericytochromatia bacterium]
MRIQELKDKKVAIWGLGSEGWSTLKTIRKKFPALPITVLNDAAFSPEMEMMLTHDPFMSLISSEQVKLSLKDFDIIIKSPGISAYRPEIQEAKSHGVIFISATHLWFQEHQNDKTVCITGTKGKSTTSSLITHLLRNANKRVTLGGNIGTPMLDMLDVEPNPDVWVMELSSYQISDFSGSPSIALLLNLFPEHLDWHLNEQNYYNDKLKIFANQKEDSIAILNKLDENTAKIALNIKNITYFNDEIGFHVKDNCIYRKEEKIFLGSNMTIPGNHNLSNACAALTVVEKLGIDINVCIEALSTFKGLPHRLYPWGIIEQVTYIDDSISTTPQSAIAALETYSGKNITILLGGFDRGLNVDELAKYVANNSVFAVITMPDNGKRIAESIKKAIEAPNATNKNLKLFEVSDLSEAVRIAKEITPKSGVIILSPGAPSYGHFKNFAERGDTFAKLSGFDVN